MELQTRPGTTKPSGRQPRHALSTAFVRNVAQAGRYCDGDGLYLDVQPSGTRSWVQRLVIRGRRRELGLGGFPLVPLKDARAQALANRRLARAGGDPLAEKRRLKSMPTFTAAATAVLAQMRPGWRNPKHGRDWLSSMERFAFPRIGKLPVSEVTSADVVDALRKVWHERPATARRVRQRISTVMEWAVALNYRDDNPCSRIGPVLGPQQDLVRHMPALPHRDVASVVGTVRASGAAPVVKLAFEFLVLTAARSGEVRGAEWAEIDTDEHVWTVPATRTKAKREHRVPLSGPALAILDAARSLANGNRLVFSSVRGKRMNDMTCYGMTPCQHSCVRQHLWPLSAGLRRPSAQEWAAETTNDRRALRRRVTLLFGDYHGFP